MKHLVHHTLQTTSRRLISIQSRCQGQQRLQLPVSVAPMVDISTPHFLELLHLISGARYAYYTEMHFSRAILEHRHRLHSLIGPPRSNVVVQLGGSDPKEMARAATILEEQGYSEININVGCPSKAVQHGQFGAVLMKTPKVVAEIVQSMQQAVSIPVTVKCRLGVDHLDSFDFLYNFVDTIHKSNTMPHLIVHARKCILRGLSPKQNRSIPPLDYDRVFQLADTFPDIPISINGGFTEADKVKQVLNRLDGCMIGRKVMDHPLFLQELDQVIYDIPSHELKPIGTIIDDYIAYVEQLPSHPVHTSKAARLPPMTILTKPVASLFYGYQGRAFRRHLAQELRNPQQGISKIIYNALNRAEITV